MQKIMFNSKLGLEQAVLEGRKTMTRRIATTEEIECPNIGWGIEGKERGKRVLCSCNEILAMSRYAKGEVIAIAQSYKAITEGHAWAVSNAYGHSVHKDVLKQSAGWENKMFVKADLMKYHIKITDIKVERLRNISDDDCLREGIMKGEFMNTWDTFYYDEWGDVPNHITFKTPREAFAALIDKVSGKGTWESNPWCFCYEFELID